NLPVDPRSPDVPATGEGLVAQPAQTSSAAALTPQTVGTSFLGAHSADSAFIPPDSMGDIGTTQFLVCVNGRIRTFTRSGVQDGALDTTTNNFFSSVRNGSNASDPRVRFDKLSGRWFLTMITVNTPNRIMIAV